LLNKRQQYSGHYQTKNFGYGYLFVTLSIADTGILTIMAISDPIISAILVQSHSLLFYLLLYRLA